MSAFLVVSIADSSARQDPLSVTTAYSEQELAALRLQAKSIPRHVAIIMDGNGRWATSRGLPRIEGHRRGVQSVRLCVRECSRLGIEQLTLYCLSSENWKRPRQELDMLLNLLRQYVIEERSEILRQGLRFSIIGRKEGLGEDVLREIHKTIELSRPNSGMRLCLAINYGSRGEMVDAVREIARQVRAGTQSIDAINEETISAALSTGGMPDPDLIIRTAGEMRLSNFLLWQSSYAELWVTSRHWPEFRPADLHDAFRDYTARDRRFGGLTQ